MVRQVGGSIPPAESNEIFLILASAVMSMG